MVKTPARYFKKVQNLSKQLQGLGLTTYVYIYIYCIYVRIHIYTVYIYIYIINSHLFGMVGSWQPKEISSDTPLTFQLKPCFLGARDRENPRSFDKKNKKQELLKITPLRQCDAKKMERTPQSSTPNLLKKTQFFWTLEFLHISNTTRFQPSSAPPPRANLNRLLSSLAFGEGLKLAILSLGGDASLPVEGRHKSQPN